MRPLRVTAHMRAPFMRSDPPVHLDAMLMAAVAKRDAMPPVCSPSDLASAPRIDLPIARSACDRYWLASRMLGARVEKQRAFVQRRFPVAQWKAYGTKRIINRSAGATKDFREIHELHHIDQPTWYAVGDVARVRALLEWVTGIGRRRAVGHGAVDAWAVKECEPWGDGFPVLDVDGRPLRNLPVDVDGIADCEIRLGRVEPPYWMHAGEQEVAT